MGRTFYTLDGMRGFAAIAVAVYHYNAFFGNFIPGGYLAVDLFFCLSGFVLMHAYGRKFDEGMSLSDFIRVRVIRLFPLYILGTGLGISSALVARALGQGDLSTLSLITSSATAAFMLPSPTWAESKFIMPLNVPAWSLFFEMVINIVFFAIYPRLTNRFLVTLVIATGVALAGSSVYYATFDTGAYWSNFFGGFPRVTFSFFAGVLVYRLSQKEIKVSPVAWVIVAGVSTLLFVSFNNRLWFDAIAILCVFPALVWAGSIYEPRSARIFSTLGGASYGVYVLHQPVSTTALRALRVIDVSPSGLIGAALLALIFATVLFLDRWYDRPARRVLGKLVARARDLQPAS